MTQTISSLSDTLVADPGRAARRSEGDDEVGELRVVRRTQEADGVVSLLLEDPSGADLPPWAPGAHLDLRLPGLVRQYSLCGDTSAKGVYRVAVLLEPAGRGGSRFVHDSLNEGDLVGVTTPRNHFRLLDSDEYLFIAGGIGITPLLPMVAEVESRNRSWRLLYGGRSRRSMAFLDELEQYGDKVIVCPQDEFGVLDLASVLDGAAGLVYCCGPEALLGAVEARCAGWAPGRLQIERFAARPAEDPANATAFQVYCDESDVTLEVASGTTILQALIDAGIDVNYECREGTCGSCELEVLHGEPDHRDSILGEAERSANDLIYPCVSRAKCPRLVLDV